MASTTKNAEKAVFLDIDSVFNQIYKMLEDSEKKFDRPLMTSSPLPTAEQNHHHSDTSSKCSICDDYCMIDVPACCFQ